MKVLIAVNEMSEKGKWDTFVEKMLGVICNLEGYKVKEKDITFGTTRSRIDPNHVKEYDLVIAMEDVDGVGIGPGTVRKYFAVKPDLRFILIVDKKKKSAGKLNALYEMGYYDALLSNDFKSETLTRLILNKRTQKEAYDYYGLMLYADYSKVKQADKETVTEKGAEAAGVSTETSADANTAQNTAKQSKKAVKAADEEPAKTTEKGAKGVQKGNEEEKKPKAKETVTKKEAEKPSSDSKTPQKSNKKKNAEESAEAEPPMEAEAFPVREEKVSVVEPDENTDDFEDEGELITGSDNESEGALQYLVPVMGKHTHIETPSLDGNASEQEIKKYIKAIEKKAFNPVTIEVELGREDEILEELLVYYTEEDVHWLSDLETGILSKELFSQHLWQRIQTLYGGELNEDDMVYIFQRFSLFMWGYDVITPLIEDPTISDIALVAYNNIQVKRYGERYFSTITFRTPNHFKNFVNHIIRHNQVDLSDKKPDKTFMDTSTSALARMRFVYSKEYINASGEPSLVIRKVPTKKYTLEELVAYDMMDYRTAAIILEEVRKGGSIIWTGTMASGKTSQMNTYLDFIRHDQRGLVMQENEELFSNTHPLLTFQNIRPSEDGETLYDLRYLATFGLLMDLNYFMIGEIKGGEAEQFVEAVYTNTTCWGSVHSISARDALPRIAALAVTEHYSEEEQLRKLAGGINMVVYLDRFVVEEVVRVKGWDDVHKCPIYENIDINIPKKDRKTKKAKKS